MRELRNAIERAMLLADRDRLEPQDFTTLTRTVSPTQFKLPPEGVNIPNVRDRWPPVAETLQATIALGIPIHV